MALVIEFPIKLHSLLYSLTVENRMAIKCVHSYTSLQPQLYVGGHYDAANCLFLNHAHLLDR